MKKIFAAFCALVLMPSFSAQAWIGGPFSNNAFFGEDGDDGVYEAVAYPIGNKAPNVPTVKNGIGTFRWAVTNTKSFTDDVTTSVTSAFFDDEGNITATFVDVRPLTSNVYFGGVGQVSHTWFIEGVAYRGNCEGSVNSGIGAISCIGQAANQEDTSQTVSSSFRAKFDGGGQGLPVSRFSGKGRGTAVDFLDPNATIPFRFVVFGSRVTTTVVYNGQNG